MLSSVTAAVPRRNGRRPMRDTQGASVQQPGCEMGTKAPSPTDRRVQRTRAALREALIGLILERGWDEVTVEQVCDRADVGRSTFYTHFADKEELLTGGFDELRRALREGLASPGAPAQPLGFARGLIEHVDVNRRLFRAIVGKRSGQAVLRRFREFVIALVQEDLASTPGRGPELEAAVHFISGGLLELLTWWADARGRLATADVERLFLQLARPAVQVVSGQRVPGPGAA